MYLVLKPSLQNIGTQPVNKHHARGDLVALYEYTTRDTQNVHNHSTRSPEVPINIIFASRSKPVAVDRH